MLETTIFLIGPCFRGVRMTVPFLPGLHEVTILECMFGAHGFHGLFRDGYPGVVGKILAIFLFADIGKEWEGWIDALLEGFHVFINVR